MLQTLFVYILIAVVLLFFCQLAAERKYWNFILIGIFIYSVIMGLRYGVGADFFGYMENYIAVLNGDIPNEKFEIGFSVLMCFLAYLDFSSTVFFAVIAFLQLYFIFKLVKSFPSVYVFLAFTFVFGCIWLTYANGLRHQLAFCLFAYSLYFVYIRNVHLHYLFLLLAICFHKSAILLLPIYPLFLVSNDWFRSIKLQYVLLFLSILLMNSNNVNIIIEHLDDAIYYLGYSEYIESDNISLVRDNVSKGMGFYVILLVNIVLIYFSYDVKKKYSSSFFSIIYSLYFIGVLWRYLFLNSQVFSRINYYFYGFEYIVAAFTLSYLYQNRSKWFYCLSGLYLFLFIGCMYRMNENTALYIFNWQNDLFYLKQWFAMR